MKKLQLSIPAIALAAALGLTLSPDSDGFSKLGGFLGTNNRDFRIFNNFTDASANNNTTPDQNFPGYDGAEMAIWKASIEWGSRLHGNGQGDPHQPGDLGSGFANFDPSFQGNADIVGQIGDNTHSEISGNGGGVLAFAEGGGSLGWRIRYYQNVLWRDGPDTGGSGFDLQGIATHEYGHALGLGHSAASGATMRPSTGANGSNNQRSLTADDAAGIQCIYGNATAAKPAITSISLNGSEVTINGANFSPANNQVWFTQAASGGNGTPVRLSGVTSTNGGTRIVVTAPAEAGPGDILVRNQDIAVGIESLSNAWPADVTGATCPLVNNYCTSTTHSDGLQAQMTYSGSQSIADNNFQLVCFDAASNKFGIFFYGPNQIQVSFGDGFRCIGGATQRLPIVGTDNVGFVSYTLDLTTAANISAGVTQNFQFWFRDPMGPGGNGFNLSDGLEVPFCD